jgi:ABC-type nitrate/sulfonate/bicarbonate transport system ATPase subunit
MTTSYLKIDHLSKTFARGTQETEVLHDITLAIEAGEYVSIIGHSGCGKSTLLNIVAGLLRSTARSTIRARTVRSCSRTIRCCPGSRSTTTSASR